MNGKLTRATPSGHVVEESSYKHGKLSGASTTWDEIGRKLSEGTYVDGARDGQWFDADPIRDTESHKAFVAGVLEGPSEERAGLLTSRGKYHAGKREGAWVETWKSGKIRSEGQYVANEVRGTWITHREDGTLEKRIQYAPDHVATETFDTSGNLSGRFATDGMGKEIGMEESFANGQLTRRAEYKHGTQDGVWERFRPDGTPIEVGAFAGGMPTGTWTISAADGKVAMRRHHFPQTIDAKNESSVTTTATARVVRVQNDRTLYEEEYPHVICAPGSRRRDQGTTEWCEAADGSHTGPYQRWTEEPRWHRWELDERGEQDHGRRIGRWVEHGSLVDHGHGSP